MVKSGVGDICEQQTILPRYANYFTHFRLATNQIMEILSRSVPKPCVVLVPTDQSELEWSGGWSTGTVGWLNTSERGQCISDHNKYHIF